MHLLILRKIPRDRLLLLILIRHLLLLLHLGVHPVLLHMRGQLELSLWYRHGLHEKMVAIRHDQITHIHWLLPTLRYLLRKITYLRSANTLGRTINILSGVNLNGLRWGAVIILGRPIYLLIL